MSKAVRQTISLLTITHGVFLTIEECNLADELMPTILYGKELCEQTIGEYSAKFESQKARKNDRNVKWMTERLHLIDDYLNKHQQTIYTLIVMVNLAHIIMNDLLERINDPAKVQLLEPVQEVVEMVSDNIDPEKDQFKAYEEADNLAKRLYTYLEF